MGVGFDDVLQRGGVPPQHVVQKVAIFLLWEVGQ